jgi:glycosyltransferase involved in cell wall biosynthesis
MISLILPYWDRQEAADKALRLLAATYAGLDLEVVVVDDGSGFVVPDVALDIKVVRLPSKSVPMCPVTAWNEGVKAASGEIIALSCVEILHDKPVLEQMAAELTDPKRYVLAAAWCPETNSWHCHSSVEVPGLPEGVGIAFLGMMRKSLYWKAGGFDEDYREGAGYEDRDFILRMLKAGAEFVIRDDLVVTHPKTGATIVWGDAKFERNLNLYASKWPDQGFVNFVCVQAQDYCGRGAEYVNNLFDMAQRNLPNGSKARFFCLTDDPKGLDDYINVIPLPADLEGWYGKLYLFKDGLFHDGSRVCYLDLDTLIVGNCRALMNYSGEFATLRDFYYPQGLGPAVMLWRVGEFSASIWREWVACGKPRNEMGDLWWLNNLDQGRFAKRVDKLQDLYPGVFVSYKKDCNPHPPQGARVVCFHGVPRPHDVAGWVADVWKREGLTSSDLDLVCNTEMSQIADNIKSACARDIPWLQSKPENDREALLVAGGPSLADDIEGIRARAMAGATVIAMNGTADYLADRGIIADYQVIIDAREKNAAFVARGSAQHLLLASQCHPSLFERGPTTLFHIALNDWDKFIPDDREATAVGGGHSVGLYAMSLAYVLGFRSMHLYGYDSSYRDGQHHPYAQPSNDSDPIIEAHVCGRTFKTTNWMAVQVNEFQALANQLRQMGCDITTHGDGLLPWVAFQMMALAKAA